MIKPIFTAAIFMISQFSVAETIWLDVRSDKEYKEEHISGSIHIPHKEIQKQASSLLPNKEADIKVYCAAGYRAMLAKNALEELGYENVENVVSLGNAKKLKLEK